MSRKNVSYCKIKFRLVRSRLAQQTAKFSRFRISPAKGQNRIDNKKTEKPPSSESEEIRDVRDEGQWAVTAEHKKIIQIFPSFRSLNIANELPSAQPLPPTNFHTINFNLTKKCIQHAAAHKKESENCVKGRRNPSDNDEVPHKSLPSPVNNVLELCVIHGRLPIRGLIPSRHTLESDKKSVVIAKKYFLAMAALCGLKSAHFQPFFFNMKNRPIFEL